VTVGVLGVVLVTVGVPSVVFARRIARFHADNSQREVSPKRRRVAITIETVVNAAFGALFVYLGARMLGA
jgi:hypothetical protein